MLGTDGYSEQGQVCYDTHDWPAKDRLNAIGAMVKNTLLTLSLFSSSINSEVFYAGLTQDLLPQTPKQSVTIMDNATFHKRNDMLDAIKQQECIVECLSAYSPALDPIAKK